MRILELHEIPEEISTVLCLRIMERKLKENPLAITAVVERLKALNLYKVFSLDPYSAWVEPHLICVLHAKEAASKPLELQVSGGP